MAQVNTDQLLTLALEMIGEDQVPPDSMIYQPGTRIGHVLVGLDIGVAELFMARQLGYHAVLAHRPAGYPGPGWQAYRRHAEQLIAAGVPAAAAEAAIIPGLARLQALAAQANDDAAPSLARLVDLPYLAIHTPFDEHGRAIMQTALDAIAVANSNATLADLRDALLALPAFAAATTPLLEPRQGWDAPAGKVAVAYGAYSPPDYAIARAYLTQGIDTLVCAACDPADLERLQADGIPGNVVVLGRLAAASVGIAPYIAALRGQGIEVTVFGGVIGIA